MIEIEDITRVSLNEGDVLAVKAKGNVAVQQLDSVKRRLKGVFPDNKVLVIDDRLSLSVVGPDSDGTKEHY